MALDLSKVPILFFLLSVVNPLFPFVEPRTLKAYENQFTKTLQNLKGVHKGQNNVKGLCEIKSYLQKFGYLSNSNSLDDNFDENLEFALKHYQSFHHLHATGDVNDETIKTMSLPRCGLPDIITNPNPNANNMIASPYTFFPGSPRWNKWNLTYRFQSSANPGISMNDVRIAMQNALNKWSSVTNFTFREQTGFWNSADIVAGDHRGNHNDGNPFDGRGGVLAHAFAPRNGRLHFDADEPWTSNGVSGIDRETVTLHEMGHILGLGHSSDPEAVMVPYYTGVRRELAQDDVNGIQALYRS